MTIGIRYPNLCGIAYKKIKSMILDNTLKTGEKILQEKMAKRLGISKIPLIQALTILENERLIRSYPRKGFYVRKISKNELKDILDIRAILEVLSVSNLAKSADGKDKKKLLKFLNDFESAYKIRDTRKYHELDRKFHYFLFESSNNDLLININDTFNILLLTYLKGFFIDIDNSHKQHKDIINAVINNDPPKAVSAVEQHMNQVKGIQL